MTSTLQTTRHKLIQDFYSFIEGSLYSGRIATIYETAEDFKFAVMVKLGKDKAAETIEHMRDGNLCRSRRLLDHAEGSASIDYIDPTLPRRIERNPELFFVDPQALDARGDTFLFNSINSALSAIHEQLDEIYQRAPPHPDFWEQ